MVNYIQSIQKLTVTITGAGTSNTGTISSVTTANARIEWQAFTSADTSDPLGRIAGAAVLTNATTVTCSRTNGNSDITFYITVTEYISSAITSIQAGSVSIGSGSTSVDGTITSVTTSRAAVYFNGYTASSTTDNFAAREVGAITLKDATHVTAKRGQGPATTTVVYYTVVDLAAALVNSMQQITVTSTSANVSDTSTITSVNTSNSTIIYGYQIAGSTGLNNSQDWCYNLQLTNATTVTWTRGAGSSNTLSRNIYYSVWETPSGIFNSVQRGTISITSATSATTTITSVTTTQSVANWLGFNFNGSATLKGTQCASIDLTNATTVTSHINTSVATTNTCSYEILEYATVVGIAFDAASNSGYQTAQSTYSWNHTVTGSNTFLVVGIGMLSVGGSSVSGITFNGISMDFLGAKASVTGAIRAELWGQIAPSSGTHSIAVTLSTGLDSAGGAVSYTGVNQSSPTEAFNSASATNVGAADATVNVTTVADNDWVVDCTATSDTAITVGTGNTSRSNVTGTLGSGAVGDTNAVVHPAGSQAMSWTNVAALATWSIVAIAIRPTAAANIASKVFRKTLSMFGSKVGGRQAQG